MARLTEITFRLPGTAAGRAFAGDLARLLAGVPYAVVDGDRLVLTPQRPAGALPRTAFTTAGTGDPEITFDSGLTIGAGGSAEDPAALVEMSEVVAKLRGHVARVDHTGVNLATEPAGLMTALAGAATVYRYPGEPWPFVLPSTAAELTDDIRDFVAGREPRFELVLDPRLPRTEWQFALATDLTRGELEAMFPEPAGSTLPGLEEIFRVVRVRHPWTGLGIRVDLSYRVDGGPSDWETGEWLVTRGGRIR